MLLELEKSEGIYLKSDKIGMGSKFCNTPWLSCILFKRFLKFLFIPGFPAAGYGQSSGGRVAVSVLPARSCKHIQCQKHKIDYFVRGFMVTPPKRL